MKYQREWLNPGLTDISRNLYIKTPYRDLESNGGTHMAFKAALPQMMFDSTGQAVADDNQNHASLLVFPFIIAVQ
ncbi:unnamed protein product [Penicillium pancosmium]